MKRLLLFALCALFAGQATAGKTTVGKRTWSYAINPDGQTCTVVAVSPQRGKVSVPAKLDGRTVTRIWISMFSDGGNAVTSLSIPSGVTEISGGCLSTSVSGGPEHYVFAEGTAFDTQILSHCPRLKTIRVASGNRTFRSVDGVLFDKKKRKLYAVPPARKGHYRIPSSVRTVCGGAFEESRLTGVTLPSRLQTIEAWGFWDVPFEKITVPASVSSIGYGAFHPSTTVFVSVKNKKYRHAGGVLYNKRKTKLLHCPSSRTGTFKIPSSVKDIDHCAFYHCSNLEKVSLGRNVKTIGRFAFESCSKLGTITLGGKLETIDYSAFSWCTGLKRVKFGPKVRTIEAYAFVSCAGISTIKLPSHVETVGYGAFCECSGLASATIPRSIRRDAIDPAAFEGCDGLKTIRLQNGSPLVPGEDFEIPAGCKVVRY